VRARGAVPGLPHVTDNGQVAQITALHVFAIGIGS
jgi:hypothetical protein